MSTIVELKAKIEYNESLLLDVVKKVCEGTSLNRGVIGSLIMYDNFHTMNFDEKEKKIYNKLFVIDSQFNKIQNELKVKIDFEKAENLYKKIDYNLFEDITKKNVNYGNDDVINKIKEYSNSALSKLYTLRKIDVSLLKKDNNGLLTRNGNNKSFTENFNYDKNLRVNFGNSRDGLTKADKIVINKIEKEFNQCLEYHFAKTKEFNNDMSNHFSGFKN